MKNRASSDARFDFPINDSVTHKKYMDANDEAQSTKIAAAQFSSQ